VKFADKEHDLIAVGIKKSLIIEMKAILSGLMAGVI
jgi:hypothetical protein